jgi:hypothetical protein
MQNPSPFSSSTHNAPGHNPAPSSSPSSAFNQPQNDARFSHNNYLIRRKILKLVGASFYVDDPSGNVILYANQKGFKLKEDIRLYTGEDMHEELLTIKARSILDFNTAYDVFDARSGQKIGALQRKGWKSMLQDEWVFLDAQDREMGTVKEENVVFALIRRFIDFASLFLPQKFDATIGGRSVATYTQSKNPLLIKMAADFSADTSKVLDRRLGIAMAILLSAIEGKQH